MSDFIDLNHDSMCALSFIRRGRFMLCTSPARCSARLIVVGQVLDAAIAVEDRPAPRPAAAQRLLQRSTRELRQSSLPPNAQPSNRREYRSITVARYRQAPLTFRYVTSPTHT